MAGTVKLPDPELPAAAELVACAELVARAVLTAETELVGRTELGAEAVGLALAERAGAAEIVDVADTAGEAAAGLLEAAEDAAVGDPVPPHAVRPAAPTTAMMTAAGTRHILMLLPSGK